MKDDPYFLRNFKKLMYEYEDKEIFEEEWNVMISKYLIKDSIWLPRMYKLKKKWAKCYVKLGFTIGM